jgi:glycosyltransferase involved in cell wall biosynthesis
MTVIEAMAAGSPIVGSNVGGIGWYTQDGVSGFYMEQVILTDLQLVSN